MIHTNTNQIKFFLNMALLDLFKKSSTNTKGPKNRRKNFNNFHVYKKLTHQNNTMSITSQISRSVRLIGKNGQRVILVLKDYQKISQRFNVGMSKLNSEAAPPPALVQPMQLMQPTNFTASDKINMTDQTGKKKSQPMRL